MAECGDVGNRIERADFVKVDFAHLSAVRARLRGGDRLVDLRYVALRLLAKLESPDERKDVREGLMLVAVFVSVVMPVVVMFVLLFAVDAHREMRCRDAAFAERLARELDAWDSECVEFGEHSVLVGHKFEERSGEHVSRRAHLAVDVERLHFASLMWLMRLARKPAPKPLSMFTTLTPAAHEFSMASSAVTPPNDDP